MNVAQVVLLQYFSWVEVLSVLLVSWLVVSLASWKARVRRHPLPPGPPPVPVLGNVFNIPRSRPWIGMTEMLAQYGDILCMRVLGQSIIVLGSPDVIVEFLEKRSANTSDRKQTSSITLTGQDWMFALMPYCPEWRYQRRLFWQNFHPDILINYRAARQSVNATFLGKLLRTPSKLREHIEYCTSAALLKVTYGVDAAAEDDEIIATVDKGLEAGRALAISGGFLVDFFPLMRYCPLYVRTLRRFAKWKRAVHCLRDAPFRRYRNVSAQSTMPPCVVSNILTAAGENETQADTFGGREEIAKKVAALVFVAGSETTSAILSVFFLAMSLYPEAQKKAQAELFAVVGQNRLPQISDRDSLLYVNALLKECLRWLPVVPLGVSHSTTKDDEFRGYFIPADSIIIANVWACMRDPAIYEDPAVFRPERFIRDGALDPNVRDPEAFVFGFGRRICPGRYFALESLFCMFANVLHVFDVTPPLDEQDREIIIEPSLVDSFSSRPEDCRCTIKPRGAWAEALIAEVEYDRME